MVYFFFVGIIFINVFRLNFLKIVFGGYVGRFCIWIEFVFRKLDKIYGLWKKLVVDKKDYK